MIELNNFNKNRDEFACKCGCGLGTPDMDQSLLLRLDRARDLAGVPFTINSGIRCEQHNAAIGASMGSSHIAGYAADISATDSRSRFKIIKALIDVGFNRIGIHSRFIHVDNDPDKDREVVWDY